MAVWVKFTEVNQQAVRTPPPQPQCTNTTIEEKSLILRLIRIYLYHRCTNVPYIISLKIVSLLKEMLEGRVYINAHLVHTKILSIKLRFVDLYDTR